MPHYYAWEAAERASLTAHAVTVSHRATQPSNDLEVRTGDRDVVSLCGRKIGQGADLIRTGRTGHRYTVIRGHLRLRLRSELAHLPRCRRCLASVNAKWRRVQQEWRDAHGGEDLRMVEWISDRPAFADPVIVQTGNNVPAPFPTYYRYSVNETAALSAATTVVATTTTVLPSWWSWLPTGATIAEAATNAWTWDFRMYGVDYHRSVQVCRVPDLEDFAPAGHADQVAIARRRETQQAEWMAAVHAALEQPHLGATLDAHRQTIFTDMNAMDLVRDVCGPETVRSLAATGYVDVESAIHPGTGYRIRPWRRIGLLVRGSDGWTELAQSLCIHPDDTYPLGDEVATLWLAARFNEATLLGIANVHDGPAVRPLARDQDGVSYVGLLAGRALAEA